MSQEDFRTRARANGQGLEAIAAKRPELAAFRAYVETAELARGLQPQHVNDLLRRGQLVSQYRIEEGSSPANGSARAHFAQRQGEPWGTRRNEFEMAAVGGDDFIYAMLTPNRTTPPGWGWITVLLEPNDDLICVADNSLRSRYWSATGWDRDRFATEIGDWEVRGLVTLIRLAWDPPPPPEWSEALLSDGAHGDEHFTEVILVGTYDFKDIAAVTMQRSIREGVVAGVNKLGTSTGVREGHVLSAHARLYRRLVDALSHQGLRVETV